MNYSTFVELADARLLEKEGWHRCGHNGSWPMYSRSKTTGPEDLQARQPLPAILVWELAMRVDCQRFANEYLVASGWVRQADSTRDDAKLPKYLQPRFGCDTIGQSKTIDKALLEQMKNDRLDRAAKQPVVHKAKKEPVTEWICTATHYHVDFGEEYFATLEEILAMYVPSGWKCTMRQGNVNVTYLVDHVPTDQECRAVREALLGIDAIKK